MAYRLTYSILFALSLLPLWMLYGLAHLLYFVLYVLLGYRKDVVRDNLAKSFPDKTLDELKQIERKFYRNLCDSIVETIKLLSISKKNLSKHMTADWDLMDNSNPKGNSIIMVSHQFNWEWSALLVNAQLKKQFIGPYLPVTSKTFDRLMLKIRSRFGSLNIPVRAVPTEMVKYKNENVLWGFIADQTPADTKRCAWEDFFNRKTAFAKGGEILARRYNAPVLFAEIVRLRRGYYRINTKLTFENPRETVDGEITAAYVRFLEDSIKRQPDNWVWSHRRWKHVYQTSD